MSQGPSLTVAICTYKRPTDVDALLGDLLGQIDAAPDVDILVLDNADDAATADVVARRSAALPGLRRVVEREAGLSRARNAAAANTTARHIWFLDDDVRLRPGFLAAATAVLAAHDPDLVGGPIEPVFDAGAPPPGIDPDYLFRRKRKQSGWWASGSLSGGNFAVKRTVFERIGGFRTDLGMIGAQMGFLEELEFALRYRASPDRDPRGVYYACDCVVGHRVPEDKARLGYLARRQWKSHRQLGELYCAISGRRRALGASALRTAVVSTAGQAVAAVRAPSWRTAWTTWLLATTGRLGFLTGTAAAAVGASALRAAEFRAPRRTLRLRSPVAATSQSDQDVTHRLPSYSVKDVAALAADLDLWAFDEIVFDRAPPLSTLGFLATTAPLARPTAPLSHDELADLGARFSSALGLLRLTPELPARPPREGQLPSEIRADKQPVEPRENAAHSHPQRGLSSFNSTRERQFVTTGFESQIHERVERAVTSPAYRNYLTVRRAVYAMMDEWNRVDPAGGPSGYWKEEIEGFLYLLDASPLVVDTLREQCYHITGIKSYEYRSHHTHMAGRFKAKYDALKAIDTWGLFVPEAEPLSGFGFDIGVGRVNIDTLKFYEVLIGLARSGALSKFSKSGGERRTVVEIGSGWGGFAYQFKTLYPNTTYVCVDLPMTMLFSGTYLRTLFPNAKVLSFGEPDFDRKIADIKSYDFVFVPHFYFPKLTSLPIDLAVNMVSFQEMTTGQVDGYVRQLAKMGVKQLYSMNRDRSKHNKELSTVSEILKSHYKVELVPVLDAQYTQLEPPKAPPGKELHVLDYRHYYATL